MKTLYESILDRTKDKVQKTKDDIERLRYFGGQFKFNTKKSWFYRSDISIISIRALKRLTEGMEFKNPDTKALMERGFLDYSDKLEMFIKWLENLDISRFGYVDLNNHRGLEKLCLYIKNRLFDDGLFNKPEIIDVRFKYSIAENKFYIVIDKNREYSKLQFHFDKI
jgi:hypothetical protein